MNLFQNIEAHREVQAAAKRVLAEIVCRIGPRDTERTIAAAAVELLARAGITETWYYDCPALVFLGSRSRLSCSSRDYTPSDEPVGDTNLVTIDLSPARGDVWGDCTRSFFIERGRCVEEPNSAEFREGFALERLLHERLREFAAPETTCDELVRRMHGLIAERRFENLDFLGNLGHSIERRREDRRYLEPGYTARLGDLGLFTFEPHLAKVGRPWGFKHENIYYFDAAGRLEEL
jgi:Xaa-Pro aminopeptidase